MIARKADLAPPGPVAPTVAQLLAEELVTEMVRKQIDVVGLLELERDVIEAVSAIGEEVGADKATVPAAALAAHLVDRAFRKVEAEWRMQRSLCDSDECVCCAMEAAAAGKRRGASS